MSTIKSCNGCGESIVFKKDFENEENPGKWVAVDLDVANQDEHSIKPHRCIPKRDKNETKKN